jgi:4-azaleucine resistance transporter AzlC
MNVLAKTNNEIKKGVKLTEGIKVGIPIAIGYIPIAITFGLISKSANMENYLTVAMSIFIFAGASQFMGVNLISGGASTLEIVLTTFILNFRHFLMSSSLSQRLENNISKKLLSVLPFGITDETFAVASMREEDKLNPWFLLGLNTIAYLSWVGGTAVGLFLGDTIPSSLKNSMGIALYVMFIGLLVPSVKGSRSITVVVSIAALVNCAIKWMPALSFISLGWSIIISTLIAAAVGALVFPVEEDK